MSKKLYYIVFSVFILFLLVSFLSYEKKSSHTTYKKSNVERFENLPVMDVLIKLGMDKPYHYMQSFDSTLANVGEQLITKGKANYKGKRGRRISSYFQCTDCHSLGKETESLKDKSPDARLSYAIENDLPFYPASTLMGLYNREKFYNDDYYKKYGEMVFDARDSIHNAIQLCAKYCASGRYLEDWELDAMMHFFKKEELKLKHLTTNNDLVEEVAVAIESDNFPESMLEEIKSLYISSYNANFAGAMPEDKRTYGENGNALRGEQIYERSCIHCHGNSRVTYLDLGKDVLSGKYLWNNKEGYDDESIYQVIRWGTFPKQGRRQYMPLYTHERMTDDQIEDLMAYIKKLANK